MMDDATAQNPEGDDIDGFFTTARTTGRDEVIELPEEGYEHYLPGHDDAELAPFREMSYQEFTDDRQTAPFLRELLEYWDGLYREPFVGITADGAPQAGLYRLPDDGAGTDPALVAVAESALELLTRDERERVGHPIDAQEWRAWSNPEFVIYRVGLRLEDLAPEKSDAILDLVRASLSPKGYERVREAMDLNGFLGELVDLPKIMNPRSYWFSLFGTPSVAEPWGWQLFGHHVAVNVVMVGGRQVIAPVFLGAEPAVTDESHPPMFAERERLALDLAGSLTDEQRARAVVYRSVLDPSMPADRLHPADERHVAGAFRDNRVVPYEGIRAAELDERQRGVLRGIIADALLLLRDEQREATLRDVDAHLDDTRFAWYGSTDGSQPFYFRIQSPVILTELDHHAGVWLTNTLPARFHVHTTLRLPNGNDYGKAYLAQWFRRRPS